MDKQLLTQFGVEVDEALEFWGDMDSYNESLKEFHDSINEKLENLNYFKNKKNCENYGILAHSIKSEAKYLGFMREADIFFQHELAGKEKNQEFINDNFGEIILTFNKIRTLLDKYFGVTTEPQKYILIADDSNIMLNFIEKTIGDEYKVIKASTGKEAIKKIEELRIYAILLDLNMPNVDGFGVLDYLKENELIEKIPVIIVTGDDTEDTIKKAFTYPILDVLNKPFKEDNIKRILVSIKSFYEKE